MHVHIRQHSVADLATRSKILLVFLAARLLNCSRWTKSLHPKMPTIHEDAWNNQLKSDTLKAYLANDKTVIDSTAPINVDDYTITVTPLAAACCRGHLDVVKLLLRQKADPNAPSQYGRTPLYFVTTRTPPPERSAIVQALITAGAKVNLPCYKDDGPVNDDNTPLVNAIIQIKDKEVVSLLVNNGASRTPTVEIVAKEHRMTPYLLPTKERKSSREHIVDLVMSMVGHTIAFANKINVSTEGLKQGIVKEIYNFSGNLKDVKPKPEQVRAHPLALFGVLIFATFRRKFSIQHLLLTSRRT